MRSGPLPVAFRCFRPLLFALCCLPLGASASDGVIEINQACATATGCMALDDAGFPVTIRQSGSYRLTGNLRVENPDAVAIDVTGEGVTLDLGGFTIEGTLDCPGAGPPNDCKASGTGVGVRGSGSFSRGLTLRNGVIRDMHGSGIQVTGTGLRVEDVRVIGNGGFGVRAGNGASVESVHALRNLGIGIRVGGGGTCSISSCIVQDNLGAGIEAAQCVIRGNAAFRNAGSGIAVSFGGSTVIDNVSRFNGGPGLSASSGTGYGRNMFQVNSNADPESTADVVGPAIQLGPNICGSALCP